MWKDHHLPCKLNLTNPSVEIYLYKNIFLKHRVSLGSRANPLNLKINLNCPIPIILDYLKRKFINLISLEIKIVKEKIQSLKSLTDSIEPSPSIENNNTNNINNNNTTTENLPDFEEILEKYELYLSELNKDQIYLDILNSNNVSLECAKVFITPPPYFVQLLSIRIAIAKL